MVGGDMKVELREIELTQEKKNSLLNTLEHLSLFSAVILGLKTVF